MEFGVRLAFDEQATVRLLNFLARENERILLERPRLPLLYSSQAGIEYRREVREVFSDYLILLAQGWEDCDGLAAARAGELLARGYRALRPGDGGYQQARRERLDSIPAWVFVRTKRPHGKTGLYHCIVRYRVGNHFYRDDPSARLGMLKHSAPHNPYFDYTETEMVERGVISPADQDWLDPL